MNKIIAFLAIIFIGLAGVLIYLVAEPYMEMKNEVANNTITATIYGNIVGEEEQNTAQEQNISNEIVENNITNQTTNVINPGSAEIATAISGMTKDDIDLYNISFTGYEGSNMNGQIVRAVIDNVITSNNTNVGKQALFVAVTQNYDNTISSTIGKPGNLENTQDIVFSCNEELNTLKDNTNRDDIFDIECIYESGIVIEVKITKME